MRYNRNAIKGEEFWNRDRTAGYALTVDVFKHMVADESHFKAFGDAPELTNGCLVPNWLHLAIFL